jgi:hypothetical protein
MEWYLYKDAVNTRLSQDHPVLAAPWRVEFEISVEIVAPSPTALPMTRCAT